MNETEGSGNRAFFVLCTKIESPDLNQIRAFYPLTDFYLGLWPRALLMGPRCSAKPFSVTSL